MILGVLQARMNSTRFPGKVLMPILGRPMLDLQIERLRRCRRIDDFVVATSVNPEDQPIAELCYRIDIACFRGSEENVLDRVYRAVQPYRPDHVVRLTGDCPLADPGLIDELVQFYFDRKCDYASNCHQPSLPDGLDAEIFTFDALEQDWREAELPSHIEHVTPFIRSRPERFKIGCYKYPVDLSYMRWTVDEPEDLEFVRKIYETLYEKHPGFSFQQVLEVLDEHPEWIEINREFERNEGAKSSREKDKKLLSRNREPA
jgi:spore coat polysaccharide biosynthesis protein SpsF (cytidylyltransferase family)